MNRNLGSRIFREWCLIESWYEQKTIIKSYIGFPKKLEKLTFVTLKGQGSLTRILDAEYLANCKR